MFCCDQRPVGQRKKTAAVQRRGASQVGKLLVDDIVFFQLFLIRFHVININGYFDRFGNEKNKTIDQTVGCFGANEGLVPLGVFLHFFVAQPARG